MKLSLKRQIRKLKDVDYDVKEIIEYLIGGGLYFWIGYGCFFVFYHQFKWTLLYAKILADLVGWTFNYLINRYWVFTHQELKKRALKVSFRYTVITLFDFALDYTIVRFFQF